MAKLPYKLKFYETMKKRKPGEFENRTDTDTDTQIECYLTLADYSYKYITLRKNGTITQVHFPAESKLQIDDQILEINNTAVEDMTCTDIQNMFNVSVDYAREGTQLTMIVRRVQQQFDVDVFLLLTRNIEDSPETTGQTEECVFKVGPSFSDEQTKFLKCANEEILASIVQCDHDNYFLTLEKYLVEIGNRPLHVYQLRWNDFCITSSISQISSSIRLVQASSGKENMETFFIMKRNFFKGVAFESLLHKDHYITYDRQSSTIMMSYARGTGSVPLEARFNKLKKDSLPKHEKKCPDTDDKYANNNQDETSENRHSRDKRNTTRQSTIEDDPSSSDTRTELTASVIQTFSMLVRWCDGENNRNG